MSQIREDAPKQTRGLRLIAGNTQIILSLSRLNQGILWFVVHSVWETRCSQLRKYPCELLKATFASQSAVETF